MESTIRLLIFAPDMKTSTITKDDFITDLLSFHNEVEEKKLYLEKNSTPLLSAFEALAKKLMYGWHLRINGRYEIYIRSCEFYFHYEDKMGGDYVHDPVMFHRNKINLDKDDRPTTYPIFSVGHLFLHQHGLDITFEKSKKMGGGILYRASALIKSFNVIDLSEQQSVAEKNKEWTSSFIYDYLQFMDTNNAQDMHLEWEPNAEIAEKPVSKSARKNIYMYNPDANGMITGQKSGALDKREWRFLRAYPYNNLTSLLEKK